MELVELIVLFLVGYFLFRLIFNVVVPVTRTVRMVRREFAHQETPRPETPPADVKKTPNWDKMGDYIDFEEVK